jgi:hypothetical protein
MKFDPDIFTNFIRSEFALFRGEGLASLNDFGKTIPVSSQVISNWWNGKLKQRPSPLMCDLLISKWGEKAYLALGLPIPGITPENSAVSLSGLREILHIANERGISEDDPEFVHLAREVFAKYDVKVEESD